MTSILDNSKENGKGTTSVVYPAQVISSAQNLPLHKSIINYRKAKLLENNFCQNC